MHFPDVMGTPLNKNWKENEMKLYIVEVKSDGRWGGWTPIATFNNPVSEMLLATYRQKYPVGTEIRVRMEVVM